MDMWQDTTLEIDKWKETRMELGKGWIWIDPCQEWVGKCVARRFGIHHGQHPPIVGRTFGLKSAYK